MDKKSAKHKMLRRKYKRYAAAVAGAAIMAGASLPGLPVVSAAATGSTDSPAVSKTSIVDRSQQPVKKVATKSSKDTKSNKSTSPGRGWHQHKYSWPGSDENRGWVDENGRIYYRSDNYRNYDRYNGHYYRDHDNYWRYSGNYSGNYSGYSTISPVDFAKTYASRYGFNRNQDSFTLVSQTNYSATVLVQKSDTGKQYIMDMERDNYRSWQIVAVRGITR